MNRRASVILSTLVFLFALNFFSLSLPPLQKLTYETFRAKPKSYDELTASSLMENLLFNSTHRHSKPWPILPSYLPWSPATTNLSCAAPFRSCEAYFGNGFTRKVDLLNSNTTSSNFGGSGAERGGGWFRCWYSETLRSSICEGRRVRMVPEKIHMATGGEKVEEVIGRTEDEEMPEFENGAFEIDGGQEIRREKQLANAEFLDQYIPKEGILKHTMRELVASMKVVASKDFTCDEWIEEPTLLVTRFEYANLFHSFTDWYSAYVASRVINLPSRPHIIFVDGHCTAPLEETWEALFSSLRYAKNFSGPVCFRQAILSPLGYETALFRGLSGGVQCDGASARDLWHNPNNLKTARLSEFGEMIRAAFDFPLHKNHIGRPLLSHNVLFIRRENYLAHPRHHGKVESRLSNEQEVYNALKTWVSSTQNKCRINIVNGLFAHMSMKEQVRAIQDASVIVGAHGAGMTHIISALPKTVILEIISSQFRRPHFQFIAQWKGLEYHAINLVGSYADTKTVVDRLKEIMRSLGC